MTTFVRPSVQRSLDLIALHVASALGAMTVTCPACGNAVSADQAHVCPTTDAESCAQGSCARCALTEPCPVSVVDRWSIASPTR